MFDSLETGVSFLFSSNSKTAFGDIVKGGKAVNQTLFGVEAAFNAAGAAADRAAASFMAASDVMTAGFGTVSRAATNTARSATSSAADFAKATSGMGASADIAAEQVVASTTMMSRGLAGVASDAFMASRALQMVGAGRASAIASRSQLALAADDLLPLMGTSPATSRAYRMKTLPVATTAMAAAAGGGRSGPPGWPRGTAAWAGGTPGGWGSSGYAVAPPIGPGGPGTPVGGGGGRGRGFGGLGGAGLGAAFGSVPHALMHGVTLGAEAAGGALIDSVYEAAKLQTNMLGIKNSTGASPLQLSTLQQSIFDTADMTGASAVQMSKEFLTAARSSGGVFRNKDGSFDMSSFGNIMGDVAKAAEVQHLTRGTDRAEAVRSQMETVHLFRDFKGAGLRHILDLNTRLSEVMPNSQREALKQFTYFEPTFKAMGISDDDSFATLAAFSRAGYGTGKGGTNTQDLIQAALPALEMTRHAQSGKKALLEKYGFLDKRGQSPYFNNNKADLTGFIGHLGDLHNKYGRDDLISAYKSVFGQQGSRMANVFSDPKILEQLIGIKAILHDPKLSLNEQFRGYQDKFTLQRDRAGNNFQSLMAEVGGQALPGFTRGLRDLGDAFHGAQKWLHQHGALEMQVQRDITNAVMTTEGWVKNNSGLWKDLRHDLALAYGAGKQLAPQLLTIGDGFKTIVQDITWLADQYVKLNSVVENTEKKAGNWLMSTPGGQTQFQRDMDARNAALRAGTGPGANPITNPAAGHPKAPLGPNYGLQPHASMHTPPRHVAYEQMHASARTHKLADVTTQGRAIHIGEFTVYAAHGDDLSDLINYVEKHADKNHVGTATPTQPAVRSGATPGTSHAAIG